MLLLFHKQFFIAAVKAPLYGSQLTEFVVKKIFRQTKFWQIGSPYFIIKLSNINDVQLQAILLSSYNFHWQH